MKVASTTSRRRPDDCLSDLLLDRFTDGELARDSAQETLVEAHLGRCPACSERLEEMRRLAREFPLNVDVAPLVLRTERELMVGRALRRGRRIGAAGALAALAAAASLLLWWQDGDDRPAGERRKGDLALDILVRHRDGRVEEVAPGQRLTPDEAIRFRVVSERPGFAAIVGVDTAQVVTPYVPLDGSLVPIQANRRHPFAGSIVLDQTLGPERVVAAVCESPIDVSRVVQAAAVALARAGGDPRALPRLDLPCRQTSLWFEKVAP